MNHRTNTNSQSSREPFTINCESRHFAPDMRIYPVDGNLRLQVEVATGYIKGEVTWTLNRLTTDARTLWFDAVDLEVHDVFGENCDVDFRYDGTKIVVRLDDSTETDSPQITIRWSVKEPKAGFYFIGSEGQRGRAPFEGFFTDHETERARYWLPCIDHPAVRTSFSLELCTDTDIMHLGCGLKTETGRREASWFSKWRLDEPCPSYLLCLGAGALSRTTLAAEHGISLDVFGFPPTTAKTLSRSFQSTPEMMSWMVRRLSTPFPYPKYWQFVAPGVGGAMENISLTSWDESFFGDKQLHDEFGEIVDIINLHEMAHSYFGDLVVIRDYAHAWLKEGWATYMESVWLSECVDRDAGQCLLQEDRLAYLSEVKERYSRPIVTREFDHSWQMYDRHLYQGSAWRLHMLRHKLGDDSFWAGTKLYLERFGHTCAETSDFRKTLESTSGYHLSRFFEDWFYRTGCPKVSIRMEDQSADGGEVFFSLTIDKPEDQKEAFDVSLTLQIEDDAGRRQTSPVIFERGRAGLSFKTTGQVREVILDPEGCQLFRLESTVPASIYVKMLESCDSIAGIVQAAQCLCELGSQFAVNALREFYKKSENYGLRRILVLLVSSKRSGWRNLALADWLVAEHDPKVRYLIARSLVGVQLPSNSISQIESCLNTIRGDLTRGHVLEILGSQKDLTCLPLLLNTLSNSEERESVRAHALAGIGRLCRLEGFNSILERYELLGDHVYLRRARHTALARCARSLERRHRETALDTLRFAAYSAVGHEALAITAACVTLGEGQGVNIISSMLDNVDHQTASGMRKQRMLLEKSLETQSPAGRVERLEKTVEKLETQLAEHLLLARNEGTVKT